MPPRSHAARRTRSRTAAVAAAVLGVGLSATPLATAAALAPNEKVARGRTAAWVAHDAVRKTNRVTAAVSRWVEVSASTTQSARPPKPPKPRQTTTTTTVTTAPTVSTTTAATTTTAPTPTTTATTSTTTTATTSTTTAPRTTTTSATTTTTAPTTTTTTTASTTTTTAAPASAVSRYGVAAGGNMHNLGDVELAREMDDYAAAGSRWVRIDINWSLIQRGGPTSYDWASFDRVVRAARSRNLNVLAGILYTPAWARPGTADSAYPPADLATYAAFARAAVQHYAPMGVRHWEIWNEPNIHFWKPVPEPERYAQMLRLSYAAIKQADPQAFVISAGLAPYGAYGQASGNFMNPLTFLERMYAAGAAGSFDALGWHPYNFTGIFFHPASAWSQVAETSPSARSMMVANGDGAKQIWGTEFGAPTGTSSEAVTEAAQAQLVANGYAKWRSWSFAGPLFWFSLRDAGSNLGDREHNFGLVRTDYSRKPSFEAYRSAAAAG